MKYVVSWIDATMTQNYGSERELIEAYARLGITIGQTGGDPFDGWRDDDEWGYGWYDFEACHEFQADDDQSAMAYVRSFHFGYRNVECFTLKGIDTDEKGGETGAVRNNG